MTTEPAASGHGRPPTLTDRAALVPIRTLLPAGLALYGADPVWVSGEIDAVLEQQGDEAPASAGDADTPRLQ